jgi:hypothetical protein
MSVTTMQALPVQLGDANLRSLQREVRAFVRDELGVGGFVPSCDAWLSGWDEEFSRRVGARGWIGI